MTTTSFFFSSAPPFAPAVMTNQDNPTVSDLVFSIPQLVASISRGLSYHDLTNCVRVNHDWNRIFSFEFLRRDNGRVRGVLRIQEGNTDITIASRSLNSKQTMTRQEIMAENRRVGERPKDHGAVRLNNEEFISDGETSDKDADNEDQREAHSTDDGGVVNVKGTRLFRILRDRLLPYTYLEFYWFGRDVLPGHWSRNIVLDQVLESMTNTVLALDINLVYEYAGEDDMGIVPLPDSLPKRISRCRDLTSLTLTTDINFGSVSDALGRFLEECPDLKRLSLCYFQHDTEELGQLLKRHCPKITDLTFQGVWYLDTMVSLFPVPASSPTISDPTEESLQEMSVNDGGQQNQRRSQGLRSFSCSEAYFLDYPRKLIDALQSHFSTLESVEVGGIRLRSSDIEIFLNRCPRLEHLSVNAEWNDEDSVSLLDISAFRSSTPWVCLGLKCIALEIRDKSIRANDYEKQKLGQKDTDLMLPPPPPDALVIYQRLSELTALESAQLGFAHYDQIDRTTTRCHHDFDFSLASGLDLLKTWRRLKKLLFFPMEGHTYGMIPKIGQAEVEWMAENWPELQEIQLNIQQPEEGTAEAEQWKWLKETRPDINVHFARDSSE